MALKLWTTPHADELFSSWIVRASFDYGCNPMTFTGLLYPGNRIWTQDRDRKPNPDLMRRLRSRYNFDTSLLNNAFLKKDISLTTSQTLLSRTPWPWVLPYGLRNRRSIGGLQFCQLCLSEKHSTYLPKHSRYAWHVVCAKHKSLLQDRCANCRRSLQIQQMIFSRHSLGYCVYCKEQVHLSPPVKAPLDILRLQQKLDGALHFGSTHFWGKRRSTHHLFNAIRLSIGFARIASRSPTSKICSFLSSLSVDYQKLIAPRTGLRFEMLPVHERAHLLSYAARFINKPKNDIIDQSLKEGITREHLRYVLSKEEAIFCPDIFVQSKMPRRRSSRPPIRSSYQSKRKVERRLALLLRRNRLAKPSTV